MTDARFSRVTTPLLLIAALLQPTGLVVMLNEYTRGGEPEHGLLFMYLGTVVRSRTLLFSSVISLMSFTGYYFRDSLANAFGLIIMGFLLIGPSAFAMSLSKKYIQASRCIA
jgi:hypothetical protein